MALPFEEKFRPPGNLIFKAPGGDRDVPIDFSLYDEIVGGATVVSAVVTAAATGIPSDLGVTPAALTVALPAVASPVVTVRISGGTARVLYVLTTLATLSTGRVLDDYTRVMVDRPPLK